MDPIGAILGQLMDPSKTDSLVFEASDLGLPQRPYFYLFLLMECDRPMAPSSRFSLHGLSRVALGRGELRSARRAGEEGQGSLRVSIPDRYVSSSHASLIKSGGRWQLEDTSKNGTLVNGAKVVGVYLGDGDLVQIGRTFFLFREILGGPQAPRDLDSAAARGPEPSTRSRGPRSLSPDLEESFAILDRVAESDVPLLITGETGTGKELTARAAHERSRRSGPFVPVNCGALPANLVESQLFGHKKGAFTGALDDEIGLVRSADHGTLFLDEIGDLPPAAQVALLRVLQEKEVLAVGGSRAVPVEFRLIAATHRDLSKMTEEGRFRTDLLARICGHKLTLPPLAARREDLGMLIGTLLSRLGGGEPQRIKVEPEAAIALFLHRWPHNVRELELALRVALAIGPTKIGLLELPETVRGAYDQWARAQPDLEDGTTESQIDLQRVRGSTLSKPLGSGDSTKRAPAARRSRSDDDERKARLLQLLETHGGNVSAVARALGKERMQVQRWMRRYAIDPEHFRTGD